VGGNVITPYNILRHELVGLSAKVVDATDAGYKCSGRIVGETRDTLSFDCGGRRKTLPKGDIVLELDLPGGCRVRVAGSVLLSRPEDRIKKKIRIKFA
jgi:ribonuclease P protein subunit POP4